MSILEKVFDVMIDLTISGEMVWEKSDGLCSTLWSNRTEDNVNIVFDEMIENEKIKLLYEKNGKQVYIPMIPKCLELLAAIKLKSINAWADKE